MFHTSPLRNKCTPIPWSSSSSPASTSQPPISLTPYSGTGTSPLHQQLMTLGIVDEMGKVNPHFAATHTLPPFDREELERLHSLRNLPLDFSIPADNPEEEIIVKIALKDVLFHLKEKNPGKFGRISLKGGGARYLSGFKYAYRALKTIGISRPESFFSPLRKRELDKPPPDYDFAISIAEDSAKYFRYVIEHQLIEMLKERVNQVIPKDHPLGAEAIVRSKAFSKVSHVVSFEDNLSLSLSMGNVDLVLYHKLKTGYISSHQALELPCDFLLEAIIPEELHLVPTSQSIEPWQAFFDCLLKRANPHECINDSGWIRIMNDMMKGFEIRDPNVWEQLQKYSFQNFKKLPFEILLKKSSEDCAISHPTGHPAEVFFSLLNAQMVLGNRLTASEASLLWNSVTPNLITDDPLLNKSLASLHRLLCMTERRDCLIGPKALLEICGIARELLTPVGGLSENGIAVRLLSAEGNIGLQLAYRTSKKVNLHVMFMSSPLQAYRHLLNNKEIIGADENYFHFLQFFLMQMPLAPNPTSGIANRSKTAKFELEKLHQEIAASPADGNLFFSLLNFYLACAIHSTEHTIETEKLLLELFPNVLSNLTDEASRQNVLATAKNVLGSLYSDSLEYIYACGILTNSAEIHRAWTAAFLQSHTKFNVTKLSKFLPYFEGNLTEDQVLECTRRILDFLPLKLTGQRMQFLSACAKKHIGLDAILFKAYCQTVYHHMHPDSSDLYEDRSFDFGHLLLQFFQANIDDLKPTPIRLEVVPFVVRELFSDGYYDLAHQILALTKTNQKLRTLFGNHWNALAGHSDEYNAFETKKKSFHTLIAKRDFKKATAEFISLIRECPNHSTGADLVELLNELWKGIEGFLTKPAGDILFMVNAIPFIHNQTLIKTFPHFCAEKHLLLLEKIFQMKTPLHEDTFNDFLSISLSQFSSLIDPGKQTLYSQLIIQFIDHCFSRSLCLSDPIKRMVRDKTPVLMTGIRESWQTQIRLVLLLNLITLRNELDGGLKFSQETSEQFIEAIYLAFYAGLQVFSPALSPRDHLNQQPCSSTSNNDSARSLPFADSSFMLLAEHEIKALLIIVKKIHSFYPKALPLGYLILFCEMSIKYQQVDNALYWLRILMKNAQKYTVDDCDLILEYFAPWLIQIGSLKKFDFVMEMLPHFRKFHGSAHELLPLFDEDFISSHPQFLLHYFMEYPINELFESEPDLKVSVLKHLLKGLLHPKGVTDAEKEIFLQILLTGNIVNAELWLSTYTQLLKSNQKKFLVRSQNILREALQRGLLSDEDEPRILCWEHILKSQQLIGRELALEWMRDPCELINIYRHNDGSVNALIIGTYLRLSDIAVVNLTVNEINAFTDIFLNVQKQLHALFPEPKFDEDFWALDLSILHHTQRSLPSEQVEAKLKTIIDSFYHIVAIQAQIHQEYGKGTFNEFLFLHLFSLINLFGCAFPSPIIELIVSPDVVIILKDKHQKIVDHLHETFRNVYLVQLENDKQQRNDKSQPKQFHILSGKIVEDVSSHTFKGVEQHFLLSTTIDLFGANFLALSPSFQQHFIQVTQDDILEFISIYGNLFLAKNLLIKTVVLSNLREKTNQQFFLQMRALFEKISRKTTSEKSDSQVSLIHHMILDLMRENEKLEYDQLPILVSIIENFVFNPKNIPGSLETHRELTEQLMDEFNTFCLNYNTWKLSQPPSQPYFMDHLRGLNAPEEYLCYLSTHKNVFSTWSALEIFHRHPEPLLSKLPSQMLINIINNLMVNIEGNSRIKRYFPKPKLMDVIARDKIKYYLTKNNQSYLSIASYFLLRPLLHEMLLSETLEHTTAAINIGGRIYHTVREAILQPSHNSLEKYFFAQAAIDILHDRVEQNLFEQESDLYFDLCKTLRNQLPIPIGVDEICAQISLSLKILDPKIVKRFFPMNEMLGEWLTGISAEWVISPLSFLKSTDDLHVALLHANKWIKEYPESPSAQQALAFLKH